MPLDTYANLQASILSWLARPGDPLVSPSIPDIIQLFEREATRRLKVGGAEKRASLTALSAAVALPADFGELRLATSGGVILTYVTPMQLPDGGGPPAHYTIIGNEMRLGPSPSGGCTIEIVYQSGVPPLSDTNTTNWLLTAHPDCYLFGSLVEAESFIGSDERVPLWAQRREAAFASIETADRKARWGGAPLSIRAEGVSGGNGTAAGDWTSAPPVPIPIAAIVAGDGLTGGGTEGIVTVALATPVTIGRGGTGATTAPAALANLGAAPLASPALTGNPTAPTPSAGDADTSIATTAFVAASYAPLASPVLTGAPTAPTPAPGDADTSIATTAFVGAALSAQALAGDVTGPTNNTTVVRLQGRPVAATAPTSLQVLQWSGTNWAPATIAAGGTLTGVTAGTGITVSGAAPSPTVALTVPVAVASGGTGSTTASAALTALGAVAKAGDTMTGNLTINTNLTVSGRAALMQTDIGPNTPGRVGYIDGTSGNMGLNGTLDVAGNTAIGTTGAQSKLQVHGAAANPPTSGTTRTGLEYITNSTDTGAASIGLRAAGGGYWLQSHDSSNQATTYPLLLNPSGSVVGVGTGTAAISGRFVVRGQSAAGQVVSQVWSGPAGSDTTTFMMAFYAFDGTTLNGGISRNGTNTVAYGTSSDGRLKAEVTDTVTGLDALMALRVRDYVFAGDDARQQGLVAQEVGEVYPAAVHVGGDDPAKEPWMIDYGRLTPLLIRAVQELSARLAALEGKPG